MVVCRKYLCLIESTKNMEKKITKKTIEKENFAEIYYVKFKKQNSKQILANNEFTDQLEKFLESHEFKKIIPNPKAFLLSDKTVTFLVIFGWKENFCLAISFQIHQVLTKKFHTICTLIPYKDYIEKAQKQDQQKQTQKYRRTSTVRGVIKKLKCFYSSTPPVVVPFNTTLVYFFMNRELAVCNKARQKLENQYSCLL